MRDYIPESGGCDGCDGGCEDCAGKPRSSTGCEPESGCPRCAECQHYAHHWIDNPRYGDDEAQVDTQEAEWVCKHCGELGFTCVACGGSGSGMPECQFCVCCGGEGVNTDPLEGEA